MEPFIRLCNPFHQNSQAKGVPCNFCSTGKRRRLFWHCPVSSMDKHCSPQTKLCSLQGVLGKQINWTDQERTLYTQQSSLAVRTCSSWEGAKPLGNFKWENRSHLTPRSEFSEELQAQFYSRSDTAPICIYMKNNRKLSNWIAISTLGKYICNCHHKVMFLKVAHLIKLLDAHKVYRIWAG